MRLLDVQNALLQTCCIITIIFVIILPQNVRFETLHFLKLSETAGTATRQSVNVIGVNYTCLIWFNNGMYNKCGYIK